MALKTVASRPAIITLPLSLMFLVRHGHKITNETMDGHVDADTENGDIPEGEDNPYVEVF